MILTILAILILGFIVFNFYTDYRNWANTGNTFAEGMENNQIVLNKFFADKTINQDVKGSQKLFETSVKTIPQDIGDKVELDYEFKVRDQGWGGNTYGKMAIVNITQDKTTNLKSGKGRGTQVHTGVADITEYVNPGGGDSVKMKFYTSRYRYGHSMYWFYFKNLNLKYTKQVTTPTTTGGTTTGGTTTAPAPAVTPPAVTTPAVTTPVVTTPAVTTPAVTTPAVTTPAVTTPAVTTPAVTTPAVTTPAGATIGGGTGGATTGGALTSGATTGGATTGGALTAGTQNSDEEIRKAYREILGREPDPSGFNHYKNLLTNGMTVAQMRTDFENSEEATTNDETTNNNIIPASTWKSGGTCPVGCSEPICVDGNCKDVTVNGAVYKGCFGTCKNYNNEAGCSYDNQCTAEACGIKYYDQFDKTPCNQNQQWNNSMWGASGPVQGLICRAI